MFFESVRMGRLLFLLLRKARVIAVDEKRSTLMFNVSKAVKSGLLLEFLRIGIKLCVSDAPTASNADGR